MRMKFLIFCLILALLFPTNSSFKVGTSSEPSSNMSLSYEQNLTKAAEFLNNTQFNQAVGLCRVAPIYFPDTYFLVNDNLLAYHALKYYHPETAETIYNTMKNHGYFRSYKIDTVFGTTVPYIPFKDPTHIIIDQIGNATKKTEVCNGTEVSNFTLWADLCIFAALHYHWIGNGSEAVELFNIAKHMWDGKGLYDNVSLHVESKGEPLIYSTFKLALLLYASRILNQPLENKTCIEEALWRMQDENGGLHTDYDANLNYTGSDVNTETTALAILAYKYNPEIVNRPASYPPNLGVPPDYQKIQEAINNANEEDIIYICNGTYYEHVIINKTISLIGKNRRSTIMEGNGTGTVVGITAQNVSISNLTIMKAGFQPPISGAIVLNQTNSCVIEDVAILGNDPCGISLFNSTRNRISRSKFFNNEWALILVNSKENLIVDNLITKNSYGIGLGGPEGSSNNILAGNEIVDNVKYGIDIFGFDNRVSCNRILNNSIGVLLDMAVCNCISRNIISNNTQYGIHLIQNSSNNTVFQNNFIDNKAQAYSSTSYTNYWDNGFEGNYWNEYNGMDGNTDGIGDTPYVVDGSNQDNYPLMGIFHSYDTSYVVSGYVTVVSNSTISDFAVHPELRWIEFKVTGETGIDFCRICIPYKLMNPPYNVTIDNGETPVLYINDTIRDNGTHRWIYFTYPHTTHKVIIIPEFLSNTIVAIFMITSLIATIMAKKRRKSVT